MARDSLISSGILLHSVNHKIEDVPYHIAIFKLFKELKTSIFSNVSSETAVFVRKINCFGNALDQNPIFELEINLKNMKMLKN